MFELEINACLKTHQEDHITLVVLDNNLVEAFLCNKCLIIFQRLKGQTTWTVKQTFSK